MNKLFSKNHFKKIAQGLALVGLVGLSACDNHGAANGSGVSSLDGMRLDQTDARYQVLGRHIVTVANNPEAGNQLMALSSSAQIDPPEADGLLSQNQSVYMTCKNGSADFSVQIFGDKNPNDALKNHLSSCDGEACDTGYLIAYQEADDEMGPAMSFKKGFPILDATQAIVLRQHVIPETAAEITASDLGDTKMVVTMDCAALEEATVPLHLVFEYVVAKENGNAQEADVPGDVEQAPDADDSNADLDGDTTQDGNTETQPTQDQQQQGEESYAFICHEYDGYSVTMMVPEVFVPGYLEDGAQMGFCAAEDPAVIDETSSDNLTEDASNEVDNVSDDMSDGSDVIEDVAGETDTIFDQAVHAASDWEIIDETTGELVWHSYDDENNLTSVSLADGTFVANIDDLSADGEYSVRVRYVDEAGNFNEWSEWSPFVLDLTAVIDETLGEADLQNAVNDTVNDAEATLPQVGSETGDTIQEPIFEADVAVGDTSAEAEVSSDVVNADAAIAAPSVDTATETTQPQIDTVSADATLETESSSGAIATSDTNVSIGL